MVAAAALTHAQPSLGRTAASAPGVIVDLSAIDQAVAARQLAVHRNRVRAIGETRPSLGEPGIERRPLSPPSVGSAEPSVPQPGSSGFYSLFPPPPPVPAEAPSSQPSPTKGHSSGSVSVLPAAAVAALPAARPAVPVRPRFAAPAPRRPVVFAASSLAPLFAARASRFAAARAAGRMLSPVAKPVRPQDADEVARPVRLRLPYPVAATELSPSARGELEALALEVGGNDRIRLRLAAYANAGAGSAAKARRTSLSRALAVRGFLIERGIKAGRIDLRALGHTGGAAEADRVDVVISDK